MSADWAFESALTFFRQGRLEQAKNLCAQLVDRHPRHHNGLHLLGAVTLQLGELEAGLDYVRAAIAADPGQVGAYTTLANALMQQRRPQEAVPYYEMAVRLSPNDADLHNNHGAALRDAGRHAESLKSFDLALTLNPNSARVYNNRGNAFRDMRLWEDAKAAYQRAIELDPKNMLARDNLQRLLSALGQETAASTVGALELGDAHLAAGRPGEALHCYEQYQRMKPDDPEVLNRLGISLLSLKRPEEAALQFQRLTQLCPYDAAAHNNLGNTWHELDRPERALESFVRATELAPQSAQFWLHHAQTLMGMDRNDLAIESLDRCLAIDPELPSALGLRVAAQRRVCDWRQLEERLEQLALAVAADRPATSPFLMLIDSDEPALHLKCARRYAQQRFGSTTPLLHKRSPRRHQRVRLAYLSADFHAHATSYLMAGLFENHDRARFEVHAFSFGPNRDDGMRRRVKAAFDHFVDVRHLNDEAVARTLIEHEIDIVVDLKGYTHLGRSGILAFRPAPMQVSYLGYPGSLGVDFVDYIVADRHVLPLEHHAHYTEKVVTLPDSYQVNDSTRKIAEHRPSRPELGLPEKGTVFCCFNNSNKLGPEMFGIWMRLLQQVPDSVLWLLLDFPEAAANLRREAVERGVDPRRLVFASRLAHDEHLARLSQADLFLDTLPYNAHTTTSDALWAGVPVLTCQGEAFAGRVAASLLHSVALPELITYSLAEYETRALQLALTPALLQGLRQRLAAERLRAPLFDTERFRRHLEDAYIQMWQRYQDGLQPEAFEVPLLTTTT